MTNRDGDARLTRRQMLGLSAAAAAGLAGATSACIPKPPPETTLPPPPRPPTDGRRVAVFGAGVAGLTAAHELAERGFDVVVHERDHLGGKAWSVGVPDSAADGRPPLPGEHGFRFFPGFYKNLGDTMRRTPVPAGGTAYDRLVRASTYRTCFADRPDLTIPLSLPVTGFELPDFAETVTAVLLEGRLLSGWESSGSSPPSWRPMCRAVTRGASASGSTCRGGTSCVRTTCPRSTAWWSPARS